MNTKNSVLIEWSSHGRRSSNLGDILGLKVVFVRHLITSRGFFWKLFFWIDYLFKIFLTFFVLIKEKPKNIFAVTPPSLCPMACWLYSQISGCRLFVDAHNSTFRRRWIKIPFFLKVLNSAYLVIVHNDELFKHVRNRFAKAKFFILHDKIISLSNRIGSNLNNNKYFLVVLSFSYDEPIEQILKAAKKYLEMNGTEISFKFTGNYKKNKRLIKKYSSVEGIEFLGFIDQEEYNQVFGNAFGIVALTTANMLQQCASMEALGTGIPLIISNTDTNNRLFFKGAVITNTDYLSIEQSFTILVEKREVLKSEIKELKGYWEKQWQKSFEWLKVLMGNR